MHGHCSLERSDLGDVEASRMTDYNGRGSLFSTRFVLLCLPQHRLHWRTKHLGQSTSNTDPPQATAQLALPR